MGYRFGNKLIKKTKQIKRWPTTTCAGLFWFFLLKITTKQNRDSQRHSVNNSTFASISHAVALQTRNSTITWSHHQHQVCKTKISLFLNLDMSHLIPTNRQVFIFRLLKNKQTITEIAVVKPTEKKQDGKIRQESVLSVCVVCWWVNGLKCRNIHDGTELETSFTDLTSLHFLSCAKI